MLLQQVLLPIAPKSSGEKLLDVVNDSFTLELALPKVNQRTKTFHCPRHIEDGSKVVRCDPSRLLGIVVDTLFQVVVGGEEELQ